MNDINKIAHLTIDLARKVYGNDFIPLHRPVFEGNEKKYLIDCIDSNFVSSVGKRVNEFEDMICNFTGAKYAIATVNGTTALHIAIVLSDVSAEDEVITQPLTFVATCNAISYAGARPIFVDVDKDTLGMSPKSLKEFLEKNAIKRGNFVYNKNTGNKISACIPMHTFGFPCRIKEISHICKDWDLPIIEDAAESLGSFVKDIHTGNFGDIGTLSFNGNKLITSGGGGMIITNDQSLAKKAKHITTTAKIPHDFEFVHDMVGYNYRMPNINAALGCAQMECINEMIENKNKISLEWKNLFSNLNIKFVETDAENKIITWLNTIILGSKKERDAFLQITNDHGVMTRPIWRLMPKLEMYKDCEAFNIHNSEWLEERVVNLPSSVP